MEFSRQEYWSGWPFPSPGDIPDSGVEPASPALADEFFTTEPPGAMEADIPQQIHFSLRILVNTMFSSYIKCTHRCLTEHLKQYVYRPTESYVIIANSNWQRAQRSANLTLHLHLKKEIHLKKEGEGTCPRSPWTRGRAGLKPRPLNSCLRLLTRSHVCRSLQPQLLSRLL